MNFSIWPKSIFDCYTYCYKGFHQQIFSQYITETKENCRFLFKYEGRYHCIYSSKLYLEHKSFISHVFSNF